MVPSLQLGSPSFAGLHSFPKSLALVPEQRGDRCATISARLLPGGKMGQDTARNYSCVRVWARDGKEGFVDPWDL